MISRRLLEVWRRLREEETAEVRPSHSWEISVLLCFPNTYPVGVSNLGFQTIFKKLNELPGVSCDLLYFPEPRAVSEIEKGLELASFYLERTPVEFDLILFSVSFENDLVNIVKLLKWMKIPPKREERTKFHPPVGCGGIVPTANPLPFKPFFDFIVIGEGEGLVENIVSVFSSSETKSDFLYSLSKSKHILVPDFPQKLPIKRHVHKNFTSEGNLSVIVTPHSSFGNARIVEVARGCPRRCFFCLASHVQIPPRFVKTQKLKELILKSETEKVGLLGTSVSEHKGLAQILKENLGKTYGFSSVRIDAPKAFLEAMVQSGVRTLTFGIEAASEKLRAEIGKPIPDDLIFERLKEFGKECEVLKLYFMIGLPGEKEEDLEAFETFFEKLTQILPDKRITVSISPFVPKPFTPFEKKPFEGVSRIKQKLKFVKKLLSRFKNIRVNHDLPKWAEIQALISRGDENVGLFILGDVKRLNKTLYLSEIPENHTPPWRLTVDPVA